MKNALMVAPILLLLVACSGAPPQVRGEAQAYQLLSETPDPATGGLIVSITVPKAATPAAIKAAAETIIADRRSRFRDITVKTFAEGAGANGTLLAVSKLEGERVEHHLSAAMPESQRIPTH